MLDDLRKYGTALVAGTAGSDLVRMSIRKSGSDSFATGSDWSPAVGDVKISKDGGTQANITTLPSYSNGSWEFTLSATELTSKMVRVIIANASIINDDFTLKTFGNASAMYPADYEDVTRMGMTQIPASGTIPTVGTGTNQIQLSSGQVTVGGYAIGEDPATQVLVTPSQKIATDSSNRVTITQIFPTNFSSMLISGSGAVTVGTNNDKTGYSLAGNVTVGGYATGQDPATYILVTPANKLATDSSNRVTASSVSGNVQGNVNGGVLGNGVFVLSSPGVVALLDSTDTTAMNVALNLDAKISTRAVPGSPMDLVNAPNATAMNAFADALLDRVQAIDPSGSAAETVRKALRLLIGPIAGKMSGAGTGTNTFMDSSGTINRIVATVDSSGNRTAITYNP